MLRLLLAKDLLRAWRNPVPLLINLALPLCITALIALAFGEKKPENALGRVRVAIVDEDDTLLTGALRSLVTRQEALQHLDPLFLNRAAAMRLLEQGEIGGLLAIPTNFTRHYFNKEKPVALELVKNPAQSIHSTVLEEAAAGLVTALDALARNFPWEAGEKLDYKRIGNTLKEFGRRFDKSNETNFSFVTYEAVTGAVAIAASEGATTSRSQETSRPAAAAGSQVVTTPPSSNRALPRPAEPVARPKVGPKPAPDRGIFGYILVGMSAMFLLFIASHAMTDLQRELRFRTFERFHTLRESLLPFIGGKVLFALVLLLICAVIMIAGGGLAFRVRWTNPAALILLVLGYACFAVGLMALFGALMPGERRASTLNDITSMFLALAGGCMFPVRQLPALMRDHISPMLPTYWFVETAREIQFGNASFPWLLAVAKLVILGLLLIAIATWLYRRRFHAGLRA